MGHTNTIQTVPSYTSAGLGCPLLKFPPKDHRQAVPGPASATSPSFGRCGSLSTPQYSCLRGAVQGSRATAMNVSGWLSRYSLSFWFGRAVSDVLSKLAPMRSIDGQHCLVSAEPPLIEAAFDQIMADVDVPRAIETRLRPHFVSAYRSGNPGRIIEALRAAFDGIKWGEGYFDAWRMRFISGAPFLMRGAGQRR